MRSDVLKSAIAVGCEIFGGPGVAKGRARSPFQMECESLGDPVILYKLIVRGRDASVDMSAFPTGVLAIGERMNSKESLRWARFPRAFPCWLYNATRSGGQSPCLA